MPVLHYRLRGGRGSVLVEMPDRSARPIPLSWTDRALPDPHEVAAAEGARLSGLALLEVIELLDRFRTGG